MLKKFKQFFSVYKKTHQPFLSKTVHLNNQVVCLRQLVTADIRELLAVEREVYAGEMPWTRQAFLSELHSPRTHLYLGGLVNGKMIGFIGGRIHGKDCHIANIAVIPSQQNIGIGSLLIDEIIKFAIMYRCDTISLEVRISNHHAQSFYRKHGFQGMKIRKNYYTEKQEDALEMIKILKEE